MAGCIGGCLDKVMNFFIGIGDKIVEKVGFGKPLAEVTGIHIPSIDLERAEFVVDLLVTNPTPITIPRIEINYLVESDGRKLVSGSISDAGTIQAHASETLTVPLTLIFADIIGTIEDIEPGNIIPYRIEVDLIVDVPVFGKITLPLEMSGEIPIPRIPEIDLDNMEFQNFTFEETVANLHFKLVNMNDFDLGLKSLDFEIGLSEHNIGGVKLTESTQITKKGISYIDVPITFKPMNFGSALWDMISGEGASYSLKGNIQVDTPFGAMNFPIIKEGGTCALKKNKEDGGEDLEKNKEDGGEDLEKNKDDGGEDLNKNKENGGHDDNDEKNSSLSALASDPIQTAGSLMEQAASDSLQAAGSILEQVENVIPLPAF